MRDRDGLPHRMWVNQPSRQQPLHALHGEQVFAVYESEATARIYFLAGPVIDQQADWSCLSEGWPPYSQVRGRRPPPTPAAEPKVKCQGRHGGCREEATDDGLCWSCWCEDQRT